MVYLADGIGHGLLCALGYLSLLWTSPGVLDCLAHLADVGYAHHGRIVPVVYVAHLWSIGSTRAVESISVWLPVIAVTIMAYEILTQCRIGVLLCTFLIGYVVQCPRSLHACLWSLYGTPGIVDTTDGPVENSVYSLRPRGATMFGAVRICTWLCMHTGKKPYLVVDGYARLFPFVHCLLSIISRPVGSDRTTLRRVFCDASASIVMYAGGLGESLDNAVFAARRHCREPRRDIVALLQSRRVVPVDIYHESSVFFHPAWVVHIFRTLGTIARVLNVQVGIPLPVILCGQPGSEMLLYIRPQR